MKKRASFIVFAFLIFHFSLNLLSQNSYVAKCISIEDGDSITVLINGIPKKIRIYGIDAPEGTQDYGDVSANNLRYLIANKVLLIKSKYKDKFGRTVADIFLSDKDIGLQMIKSGMAWHFKKYSRDSIYSEAEKEAKNNGIGLWGLPNPIPPWSYRNSGTQNVNVNDPMQASLVANLLSEQESGNGIVYITRSGKKYHRAGCTSLRMSKIEKALSKAINDGYSPCRICNPPTSKNISSTPVSSKTESATSNLSSSNASSSSSYRSSSSYGGQCQATTKKGTRCKRRAKAGSNYCWQHG